MMDYWVPLSVTFFVVFGSVWRAIYGYLVARAQGEKFNKYKFTATMIATVFAALPVALSMFSSNIMVDTGGLVALCVTALIAGWGVDSGLKELTKLTSK